MQINLKKILSKKESLTIITDVIKEMGDAISIQDAEGKIIIDGDRGKEPNKYPVEVSGEVIGWVIGDGKASVVANLISYLAKKELEKKTMANEVLDKYREISLLHNISEKITASLDLKEVAFLVIDEARRLIKVNSGAVILLNKGTGNLEIISEGGNECVLEGTLKLGKVIFDSVVTNGRGEIINDVLSDPRFVETQEQVNSLIFVPLKTKDKVMGAIALWSTTPVDYKAEGLKLLTMLASQAASAIDNAILHENKLKESRRDALLFRLASQIHHTLDLDTILSTAVNEIRNLLQIDRCQFIWYRPNDVASSLEFRNEHTLNPTFPYWEVVNEARNPELPTLIGNYSAEKMGSFTQKLLYREMVRTSEVRTLSDPVMQQFFIAQGFTSLMAVPIRTRSGAIGVVCCGNCREIRPWSDFEVELLQAVGNQLAIALNQAEIYEQSCIIAADAQAQAQQLQKTLQELQHTQAQLIQSEKMSSLGQVVAGIAHEINNPLNFISGNLIHANQYAKNLLHLLHLYAKHYPQPAPEIQAEAEDIDLDFLLKDLPKLLSSMNLGAARISEIVLSLRNFSRLDESEMKKVDIHEGIDSTLLILESRLKATARRPPIQVIKEYSQLPLVECYPGQLNQVFMNILANAIDALDEQNICAGKNSHLPPTIQIRTSVVDNNSALIRIRDNGSGMTEQARAKLFDPFFTTKPVGKGTGLGMSISYKIVVEKHCGALTCFSQPGEGAEFWIQIPLQPYSTSHPKLNQCNGGGMAISIAR